MSVAIRDFFLYIERGSTSITPNQAPVVIFKAHSFSVEDIVFPAHINIIVLDCAEFNHTDLSHVSFIELPLSIIRG